MSTLRSIINDPSLGLIPFLDSTLGGDWSKFLVRRVGITQGLRFGGYTATRAETFGGTDKVDQQIILSYAINIDNTDTLESRLTAADFRESVVRSIRTWSSTKGACGLLAEEVEAINGVAEPTQNPRITGGKQDAWAIVVIAEFSVVYWQD